MSIPRIFAMPFGDIYPLYIGKAEKKGRSKAEVDQIIYWLTGYDEAGLKQCLERGESIKGFFDHAQIHPNAGQITGVVCGVRVEEIEDKTMQKIRYLDKLIDELAKGKPIEKILRG